MTISNTSASSGPYQGNGSTTAFPYSFAAFSAEEIEVTVDGAVLSSSLYTVTRTAGDEGGTVTFTTAPAVGTEIEMSMKPSFTQDIAFANAGPFLAESHDEAFDRGAVRDIYLNARMTTIEDTLDEAAAIVEGLGSPDVDYAYSKYLGFVATNSAFPDFFVNWSGPFKSFLSRTKHVATDTLTAMQLKFANMFVNLNGGDMLERTGIAGYSAGTGTDYITTNTRSVYIEYPAGVLHARLKFNGSDLGTHAPGEYLISDMAAVAIPEGATFWVRQLIRKSDSTNQVVIPVCSNSGVGDPDEYFAYDTLVTPTEPDPAVTGVPGTAGETELRAPPAAILGWTSKRSFLLIGDSIVQGSQDKTVSNPGKNVGTFSRSIAGAGFGFSNIGIGNDQAEHFIVSHDHRAQLFQHCTDVAYAYTNDLEASGDGNLLMGRLQTIRGYFPARVNHHLATLPPFGVTGTFTTLGGQTINVTRNAERVIFNGLVRAGPSGFRGYWEIADVLENGRDGGKWAFSGDTTDGTHPLPQAYQRIADSGAITIPAYVVS